MSRKPDRFKVTRSSLEWIIVAVVIATAIVLAVLRVWIFHTGSNAKATSIPNIILSDRATLGFVRLLTAAVALYGLASIAVLVMRGRWIRSISTTGIEAEASQYSERAIDTLKQDLRRARLELDEAKRLMSRLPDG